ncbi:glycosyltransferase family 4 protein [Brackiella oedipodis]|uniref:glycosyltransferase family 4 protein n=1 Tax=Brackiella oedipodis TaxID=124225 RepID=UPI00048EEBB1|nr:glycosyltransferase family 4 protein [Brackiella oedipodis]
MQASEHTRRPLKILHSEAARSFGGQEHRIYKEMLAMRKRGHIIELACRPEAQLVERMRAEGFTVHTVTMGGIVNFVKGVFKFRKILKDGQFDVLNTHSRKDTLIAALGARLAGTPLIVRTRHLASKIGSLLSYSWLPHRITTVSDHVRQMVLDKGVPDYKVATIYSPVQQPPHIEHSTLRDELQLDEKATVVICVAVMRPKKGHIFLLETMQPMFAAKPDLHLVLVGNGEPTYTEVKHWVEQHGLQQQVHLMGYRKDIPNLLKGADVFVLATEQEASGTVYVEAQMAGLPVIGTDVGGVSEMMLAGQTGLLVPSKDSAALAQALEQLIENPDLRQKMAAKAHDWLYQEAVFSTEKLALKTEQVYLRWLQQRSNDPKYRQP